MNIYKEKGSTLEEILNTEFSDFWSANKDSIDVCKNCEYRYMCVDNRIPILRNSGSWYFNEECDYNPFISKWKGEKGYKNLLETGVISDQNGFKIDLIKLNSILKELWED